MTRSILLTTILTLALTASVSAQDRTHAYTPYGFRLPFLEAREFVASVHYNYLTSDRSVEYVREIDNRDIEANLGVFIFDGVVAFSDYFLFGTKLRLFPAQTVQEISTDNYSGAALSDLGTYLSPEFTLVFRPSERLEIGGSIWLDSRTVTTGYPHGDFDMFGLQTKLDESTTNIRIGLTYMGRL